MSSADFRIRWVHPRCGTPTTVSIDARGRQAPSQEEITEGMGAEEAEIQVHDASQVC